MPPSPAALRRKDFRDKLYPNADAQVWSRKTNDGFFTAPRLLPYIATLIKMLKPKADPTSVYLDLWARAYDEGMASVSDEGTAAFASGYTGPRAVRTWRERMEILVELGLIDPRSSGIRKFGHVLLINPLLFVAKLRHEGKVPEEFWTAFVTRAQEIGATIPEYPPPPPPPFMIQAPSLPPVSAFGPPPPPPPQWPAPAPPLPENTMN